MAKGPGPAVALAALAGLFLLKGKKGSKETFPPAGTGNGDSDIDVGGGAADGSGSGGGSSSGGGGSSAPKNPPPNLSGYANGYNADLFQGPKNVRDILKFLGYNVAINDQPLINNSHVKAFQKHYNKASDLAAFEAQGKLSVDGTAGKNTLNALEIVISKGNPNVGIADPELPAAWQQFMSDVGA